MRSALSISLPGATRRGQLALPADKAAVFGPVMIKPVATTASITIKTAGIVVRAECGVDVRLRLAWVLFAFSVSLRLS
jgi:hypothetical protein